MKGWAQIANCIFNAYMVSFMSRKHGVYIEPVMIEHEDGLDILLERRGIIGGWQMAREGGFK